MTHLDEEIIACGACRACCKNELVVLAPEDDPSTYAAENIITMQGVNLFDHSNVVRALKKKPNGDCIYLDSGGCSIHDKRPKMCRVFSCIKYVQKIMNETTRAQRRAAFSDGTIGKEVFEAGLRRL